MRYLLIFVSAFLMVIVWTVSAEAKKQTPPGTTTSLSCSNIRCGYGMSCMETPGGPVCQQQSVTCANVLCAQGSQCLETSTGPQCVPYKPTNPIYPQQSCAYGGYYHYGQLICNPAPTWRQPFQDGWGHYDRPPVYHYPPRPTPRPRPTPKPPIPRPPAPRPPWNSIEPEPRMCTMEYAPVCAEKPVVCVRAPCPADRKTFSNSCMAKGNGYSIIHEGACQ